MSARARSVVLGMCVAAVCLACATSGARSSVAPVAADSSDAVAAVNVARMQNAFAVDLYRTLLKGATGDNLFFSPYSVYVALAMTAEGARGETALEMGRALHLPRSLARRGPGAAERPWDFGPVHEGLHALSLAAERRAPPVKPEAEARADSLRIALRVVEEASGPGHAGLEGAGGGRMFRSPLTDVVADIVSELNSILPPVELQLANSLWGEATQPFSPGFVHTLEEHYGTGGVRNLDFVDDPEGSRQRINDWVSEQTRQRITDLLPARSVNRLTRLVLASAIYFKGTWSETFEESDTRPGDFRLLAGGRAGVPLMHHEFGLARYGAFHADGRPFATPQMIPYDMSLSHDNPKLYPGRGGFQLVELPYKHGDLSLVLVLPDSAGSLAALEAGLTADRLATWIDGFDLRRVYVEMPRFHLEQDHELSAMLEAQGMTRAFRDPADARGADFGGMTESRPRMDSLYIAGVFHKAFVEVDETGTEAAAATAVVMAQRMSATFSDRRPQPFIPQVIADHPFVFLIRDTVSGNILFMGRFVRP